MQANEGSQTRARMLEKIIDLTRLNAQLFGSVGDLDSMSDGELTAMAKIALGDVLDDKEPKGIVDPLPVADLDSVESDEAEQDDGLRRVLSEGSSAG